MTHFDVKFTKTEERDHVREVLASGKVKMKALQILTVEGKLHRALLQKNEQVAKDNVRQQIANLASWGLEESDVCAPLLRLASKRLR